VRELAQPVLTVDELVIRPWTLAESDVSAVVAAYRDPAIQRWHARTMSDLEARDWIGSWSVQWDADSGADWAVTDGDQLVGRVGLLIWPGVVRRSPIGRCRWRVGVGSRCGRPRSHRSGCSIGWVCAGSSCGIRC
jgi:hypothetical protein